MSYVAATTLLDSALDRQLQREAGMPLAYYQILAMLVRGPGPDAADERPGGDHPELAEPAVARGHPARAARLDPPPALPGRPAQHLATLTEAGFAALAAAAPGHVRAVREHLFDRLSCEQVRQLQAICRSVLAGMAMVPDAPPRMATPEPSPSS